MIRNIYYMYDILIACHFSTKYLGGHTDLIGGAVSFATEELGEKLKYHQILLGSCTVSKCVQHTSFSVMQLTIIKLYFSAPCIYRMIIILYA